MTTAYTPSTSGRPPAPAAPPAHGRPGGGPSGGDGEGGGEGPAPTPRWPWIAGLAICLIGLADAGDLTYAHFTSVKALSCPESHFVNCAKVTTSSYSHLFGLPVSVLGLVFFFGMLALQSPWAWRSQWAPLRYGRLGATVVGVGMILWLLYAELFKLHAICLYCTGVHILTVLLFFVTVMGTISTAVYGDDEEPVAA
jgi:uncharacterized membrane protein